jgi:oligosaccharide repeat unit polymerase
MNLVSGICLGLCLLIIVASVRRSADVFSPGRVFVFIWALVIGLAELKFSRLQHIWTIDVWLQVLLGPLAFLTGIFIVYVLNLNTPLLTGEEIRRSWRTKDLHAGRLFWTVVILFLLFIGAFGVIRFIKGITPPLFSARPSVARLEFTMFGIGLFLHNVAPIIFLSAVFAVVVEGQRTRKWVLAALSIVAVAIYFTLLQRFQILMGAVMIVVLVYYTTRHLRWTTVFPYMVGAVGLFYWVSTLRSAMQFFFLYLYRESRMTFPAAYAWLTEPYMYFVMNVENLARGIARLENHTWGYYSLNFLFSISALKHWVEEYFAVDDMPYLVSGYNTYTSFWVYYRDFGILGITILPLLAGLAIGSTYYAMRRKPSLERVALYSLCVFLMLFSFFNNPLTLLWFVYSLALTVVGFRLMRRLTVKAAPGGEIA